MKWKAYLVVSGVILALFLVLVFMCEYYCCPPNYCFWQALSVVLDEASAHVQEIQARGYANSYQV